MPRIQVPKLPQPSACPPHAWKDESEREGVGWLLRCQKCGEVWP